MVVSESAPVRQWEGSALSPGARVIARLLINRNYALFMGGSFLSALGSWVQAVAIGWLVYDLTGSPFILGLTNFAQMAPLFFFGVLGGVLADRFDRRILLMIGLSITAIALTLLAAVTIVGQASVPLIVGISLVLGLANVIVWPAWQPFIKELVPPNRLREAIAFNAARFNLSRVLGPAIGGTILATSGAGTCLAVTASTSIAVVAVTLAIRRPRASRATMIAPWQSSLGEGILYVWADSFTFRLLAVTTLFGLAVMPYATFLPALSQDILGLGPDGLGHLLAAAGGGAVVGALVAGMPQVGVSPRTAMTAFSAIGASGALALAMWAPDFASVPVLAWLALGAIGFGTVGFLTNANAILQLRVPDHLVGRVMGLWVVLNAGTNPLGSLALGALAEHAALPTVFGVAGIAAATCAVVLMVILSDTTAPYGAVEGHEAA
jgi:MFS family permease